MKENEDGEVDRNIIAAELFEAISHPTRIQILKILEETPQGFSELNMNPAYPAAET